MANKPKKTSAKSVKTEDTTVVRIKAGASTDKKPKKTSKAEVASAATPVKTVDKTAKVKKSRGRIRGLGIFAAIGGYFKGAWVELRQVRWPNRRATWSLTGAVLVYSAFFVVIVLLLDAGFKYLFELILGK